MDYNLIEQEAGYAVYLNAGYTLTIDKDNAVKRCSRSRNRSHQHGGSDG